MDDDAPHLHHRLGIDDMLQGGGAPGGEDEEDDDEASGRGLWA